jgi:hypothetical protein
MPPARYDVFISYRRADAALVGPLRDELRRLGYRVFFDTQSIVAGEDDWKKRVLRSIHASRTLVLCWSGNASESPIVTFEYSSARALGKPVLPWLMDQTPLPVILNNIHGIHNPDPAQVAAALRPGLGWTLTVRRRLQAALAGLAAAVLAFAVWFYLRPPPPWQFSGTVVDQRMTEFTVKLADERGRILEQVHSAATAEELRARFTQAGYLVYAVKPKTSMLGSGTKKKIKLGPFLIFNQQFLTLIKAGLPILSSLDLLAKRQKDESFRGQLEDVHARIKTGESISQAFEVQGTVPAGLHHHAAGRRALRQPGRSAAALS